MSLYQFATTAEDSELHKWTKPDNSNAEQFNLLMPEISSRYGIGENIKPGLILWAEQDSVCKNNMTYEEARMFMCFVALATGEEAIHVSPWPAYDPDELCEHGW